MNMKHFLLFAFIAFSQSLFAQYTFKIDAKKIILEAISEASPLTRTTTNYRSKIYKSSLGDTLSIEPTIALTTKNDNLKETLPKQIKGISFSEKIGNVYYFNCNVKTSDEVLDIVSKIENISDVIECDAVHHSNFKLFNTLYPKQYYLHDNGGIDINIEKAWNLTHQFGENITVAVVDCGVEHNHEDLPNVIDGYTIGISNGIGNPTTAYEAHGTACAGIIGAANNTIGIRGIASEAKILPVNIEPNKNFGSDQQIAQAIIWASQRADILSCSWGGEGTASVSIKNAINYAITNGRKGKGCIIVAAAGNNATNYNGLSFPACLDGVISVGAIDRTGSIWYYSQRGSGLCVVAPSGDGYSSSDIVTTDLMGNAGYTASNYTEHFNGTSAACPQVAGVAALMLSANPNLTSKEVKEKLETTAKDLGETGYDTTYGHGLINAYDAICYASLNIDGADYTKNYYTYKAKGIPDYATVNWSILADDTNKFKLTLSGNNNRECKVELIGEKTAKGRLAAQITFSNGKSVTVYKQITLLGKISGTYSIEGGTVNGQYYSPTYNQEFNESSPILTRPGLITKVYSDDFYYYTITRSGNPVDYWYVTGTNSLEFKFPSNAKTTPMFIELKSRFSEDDVKISAVPLSYSYPPRITQHNKIINIEIAEKDKQIINYQDIKNCGNHSILTIEIYNTATGANVTKTTFQRNLQIDASSWSNGIYLVNILNKGKQITSKKIILQ